MSPTPPPAVVPPPTVVLHHDAEPGTHAVERHANVFASEFLAPTAEIADVLPARADWRCLLDLKEVWGISIQALLFRARQLRIMAEHTYRRAMTEMSSRGWRTQEPGDDGRAEAPVLLRRAIALMGDQGITLERIANEARLSVEAIDAIAPPDDRPVVRLEADPDNTDASAPSSRRRSGSRRHETSMRSDR